MARPYVQDVTTSTTASSTTMPTGFKLISLSNLDGTNNLTVSFEAAVGTTNNPEATLTPTNDTIDYNDANNDMEVDVIYHDAAAGTPILRIIGYIS